ncbi:MAG: phage virion morphogenesis protein [bacterium]
MLSVKIEGLDKFQKSLDRLNGARGVVMKAALQAGLMVLEGQVKQNIRDADLIDTGNLLNNWKQEVRADYAALVTDTPYAAIHEYGGVIRARGGGWLTFQTKDGAWHRVKEVTMPARPYIRPAIDEHRDEIMGAVQAKVEEMLEAMLK